jgi:hypothetical protein
VDYIYNPILLDCIDDVMMMGFHIVDMMDNNFVVQTEEYLIHDRMDMNLRGNNNLYYQKSLYMEFFSVKNLDLLVMQEMRN